MFAPGSREDLLDKVFLVGADAVVLDLEDAVPPVEKSRARDLVGAAVGRSRSGAALFVRINAIGTAGWQDDVGAVVRPGLTGIRVPKAESADDVRRLDELIGQLEGERGMPAGRVEFTLAIESARGVEYATDLAAASPRVRNLCFGATDFAADIGADPSPSQNEMLYALSRIVIASRVAGLDPPIGPVHTNIHDDAGLRVSSDSVRRLGCFGRSCVHPRQVPIVNAAFMPTPEEVARARRLVDTFERAATAGQAAAITSSGDFVDPAVLRRAHGVLSLSREFKKAERA